MSDHNHILVKPGWASEPVFHLPNPDDPDKPLCSHRSWDIDWARKDDPSVLPADSRVCRRCTGLESRPTNRGQKLSAKLSRMDPSEVGL